MADQKALTIRLDAELAEDMATVAACDKESLTDAIRAACAHWVETRRSDELFQANLARHISRAQRLQDNEGTRT